MSRLHNDSGGYLGARPTQNTSSHPGVHSEANRNRDRREGNWPSGLSFAPLTGPTSVSEGTPQSLQFSDTVDIGRSSTVGGGTTVVLGADDTCINVKTGSDGQTYLTVTNAANSPTTGGTATEERRTLYYYYHNGGYTTAYSGNAWPYVYVQGVLQIDPAVSAATTIETDDGRLKINGYYVYQYSSESSADSVDGIQSHWHAIQADGSGQTNALQTPATDTSTTGSSHSLYSWSVADGATTGTNWNISGSTFNFTVPANTVTSTWLGTWRIRVPAGTFRTSDNFFSPNQLDQYYSIGSLGTSAGAAVGSAKALQQLAPTTSSGVYYIKNVDGQSNTNANAKQMYCDMSTDGGGWTRFFNYDAGTQNGTYSVRYSNQDYQISSMTGSNLDSHYYSCKSHRIHRQQYSSGNYLEYMFEINGGAYRFKMNSYFEGDPGVGNRGAAGLAGYNNSHFNFGWFNNSNNGYWTGQNSSTSGNCVNSTYIIHRVNGSNTNQGGYWGMSRGYMTNCCSSSGCGDHCGNVRRYWNIFPYVGHHQSCFSGYNSYTHIAGGGRISVYYRERGTISSAGL